VCCREYLPLFRRRLQVQVAHECLDPENGGTVSCFEASFNISSVDTKPVAKDYTACVVSVALASEFEKMREIIASCLPACTVMRNVIYIIYIIFILVINLLAPESFFF